MDINKTCCFTGKRPQSLPFGFNESARECIDLKNKLFDQIEIAILAGYNTFISGMALGVDLWAAEAVLELKKSYPEVRLICAIPYKNQSYSWNRAQKKRYKSCIKLSDEQVILNKSYTKDCYFERNKYMVDNSSLVIAVCDNPPTGGTAHTLNYAKRSHKKIITIQV
ncbi:MAG: DUF1273 family protein [Clostridia bacterium]|nr:DUF1273 family protein [Clostridia bacterium]